MIVFTDLDRTLLNDSKELSAFTRSTLLKLKQKEIPLVISTARIRETSRQIYESLDCSGIIYCSGAAVMYGNELIAEYKLPAPAVREILAEMTELEPETRFSVMTTGRMYTNYFDENTVYVKNYKEAEVRDCIRLMFYGPGAEAIARLRNNWGGPVNIVCLEGKNVLVCSRDATKLNGVNAVLDHLGMRREEAVVFGDDWNDLPCMESVGYGVAVSNADEMIKRRVRYICGSNNEDGVAVWIARHLL